MAVGFSTPRNPEHGATTNLQAMNDNDIEDIHESIQILSKSIGDLSLKIETCRLLLRVLGVSAKEFDEAQSALEQHWNAQAAPLLDRIRKRRTDEALRRLLESRGSKPE